MTVTTIPAFRRDADLVAQVALDVEFRRESPDHVQMPELRQRLGKLKAARPEIYYAAVMIVAQKHAQRDVLRDHPENCPRCHGTGEFEWQGKPRKCGCPLAEARARGVSMEQDAYDRGITDQPPADPADQMMLTWGAV